MKYSLAANCVMRIVSETTFNFVCEREFFCSNRQILCILSHTTYSQQRKSLYFLNLGHIVETQTQTQIENRREISVRNSSWHATVKCLYFSKQFKTFENCSCKTRIIQIVVFFFFFFKLISIEAMAHAHAHDNPMYTVYTFLEM